MAASVAHQVGHAAEPDLRLRPDAPGGRGGRSATATPARDRAGADREGRVRRAHAPRPCQRARKSRAPVDSRAAAVASRRRGAVRSSMRRASRSRSQVPGGLPPIWADAEELELAMLNLITNSLDAMPDGGALTIRAIAARPDGVRDRDRRHRNRNPGRAAAPHLPAVGDDASRRAAAPGSASASPHDVIASARRNDHGGERTTDAARPSRSSCPRRPRQRRHVMSRILIVDDDGETCRFMAELLDRPDREIRTTQHVAEALTLARAAVRSAHLRHQSGRAADRHGRAARVQAGEPARATSC